MLKAVDDGFEGSKSLAEDNTSKLKETSEKTGETAVDEIKDNYKLLEEIEEVVKDYQSKVEELVKSESEELEKKFDALESKTEDSSEDLVKKLLEEKSGVEEVSVKLGELEKLLPANEEGGEDEELTEKIDELKEEISKIVESNLKDSEGFKTSKKVLSSTKEVMRERQG